MLIVELGDVPDRHRFSGDLDAQVAVQMLILLGEEIKQTPTGPFFTAALDPPDVALLTVLQAFEPWDVELTGDVPEIQHIELPADAVAEPAAPAFPDRFHARPPAPETKPRGAGKTAD